MTLVAISASYGAGGSRIAPALADKLGVPFVDRAIPVAVAAQLEVPYVQAATFEQQSGRGWLERVLSGFIASDAGVPTPVPAGVVTTEDFRRATEEVLLDQAEKGTGVILGRGAVVLLRHDPRAFRVRLDGPPERRLRQAIQLGSLDRQAAERAMRRIDRMHSDYTKHFYGTEIHDPSLYHLVLDSTELPFEVCVELIAQAATSRVVEGREAVAG